MTISRRTLTASLIGLPTCWLSPARGASAIMDTPVVGTWSVVVPVAGRYRIMADGLFVAATTEIALFHNGELLETAVRAPLPGEGGEIVVGTVVDAKAGDRIALDTNAEDGNDRGSQPRLAAIRLA